MRNKPLIVFGYILAFLLFLGLFTKAILDIIEGNAAKGTHWTGLPYGAGLRLAGGIAILIAIIYAGIFQLKKKIKRKNY